MITLADFISATAYLEPQEHMKVTLWDKTKIYEEDEFEDIILNVRSLAKYKDYYVRDIDVEHYEDCGSVLSCMIYKE